MTFPAWFAFHRDPLLRRHTVAQTLYAEMLIRPDSLSIPVEVKGWAWAKLLGVDRANLVRALNLLVERGYLIEAAKVRPKDPRRFTVALTVAERKEAA